MTSMEYENENGRYDDQRYDRDRSASPRPAKRDDDYKRDDGYRERSRSPNGRVDSRAPEGREEAGVQNPGNNLFVTGIATRLTEADVSRLFEKYGEVKRCSIMTDPHTQESRGFGFVEMMTAEAADAAKDGLQGENIEGRSLSIEKARRSRPRTPTPGKYFGPPKREDFRGPPRGGRYDRFDDRRGGGGFRGYGGGGRYEDSYRGSRYDDRPPRPSYGRRDDYGSRGTDRYASSRDDRYGGRDDHRGGGDYRSRDHGRSYDAPRDSRDSYGGRDANYSAEDRYSRR